MRTVILDIDRVMLANLDARLGIEDTVKMLNTLGAKVGLVTGDDHRVVVDLEAVRLDGVVCSDNSSEPRTPSAVRDLAFRLGADPAETAFVSSNPEGIRLGVAAGLVTVGVGPAMENVVDLRIAGAVRVVPHITDVVGAIQ